MVLEVRRSSQSQQRERQQSPGLGERREAAASADREEMESADHREGAGSGEREGAGSGDREGAGSADREGAGSGDREGAGSADREGAGSADREGAGSGEREGAGSGEREGAGSGDREGAGSADREEAGWGELLLMNVRVRARLHGHQSDDECSICLVPITHKRFVVLSHCGHSFHRTCITTWYEMQNCKCRQVCAMCRSANMMLIDRRATDDRKYTYADNIEPYGEFGQPTKHSILSNNTLRRFTVYPFLANLSERSMKDFNGCLLELEGAVRNNARFEYINDVLEEMDKLEQRIHILYEMRDIYKKGGMNIDAYDAQAEVEVRWNYAEELERLGQPRN